MPARSSGTRRGKKSEVWCAGAGLRPAPAHHTSLSPPTFSFPGTYPSRCQQGEARPVASSFTEEISAVKHYYSTTLNSFVMLIGFPLLDTHAGTLFGNERGKKSEV